MTRLDHFSQALFHARFRTTFIRALAAAAVVAVAYITAAPLHAGTSARLHIHQHQPAQNDPIVMQSATTIDKVATSGRVLLFSDAVEAQRVAGAWKTPKPGDTITMPPPPRPAAADKENPDPKEPRTRTWAETKAAPDGWLPLPGGAYASWVVHSDEDRVMILDAVGHGSVCINNELHTGDPYEYGFVNVPVLLKKGDTELLFRGGRGRMRAQLVKPKANLMFNPGDITAPDLLGDIGGDRLASIVVMNTTLQTQKHVSVTVVGAPGGSEMALPQPLLSFPPLSARKVAFKITWDGKLPDGAPSNEATIHLGLHQVDQNEPFLVDVTSFKVAIRKPTDTHKRTFISQIDGSVQYYSVVPPTPPAATPAATAATDPAAAPTPPAKPALVLSLHGASVEATGQAAAYRAKDWCTIVCPTNRRSYGFDWEDWGRLDALEVLDLAQKDLGTDPRRVYLTGHSMGGHGTWNLGVQFPDRFAAIAPSAGWISFLSYAGAAKFDNPTPVQQMLLRANAASDTLTMSRNYLQHGIYILHGDADDNVPIEQARTMRKHLADYHPDFAYYERPGAGHWWGNECMDWPPLFEFLKRHTLQEDKDVKHVEFVTVSPGVLASCHWVTILQPIKAMIPSKVDITFKPDSNKFVGTTENVSLLSINPSCFDTKPEYTIELDGQAVDVRQLPGPRSPGGQAAHLRRSGEIWSLNESDLQDSKVLCPGSLFKTAFQNNMVFVYGTKGTELENSWAAGKARYDAEVFWYRGNGSVDVISDTEYAKIRRDEEEHGATENLSLSDRYRNIILYGNQDTNAAWPLVLDSTCPIQIHRDSLKVGERELKQDNLCCLFIYTKKGRLYTSVGVIAGTGLPGCRLTDRLPYFVSGVGLPDWTVLCTDMLSDANTGLIGAGFFGNDWSLTTGDSAWSK